jgi:creatinine amidohydrolase
MLHGWIPPERFLPYLSAADIAALPEKERTLVIQPVGAIEQHGPHLPVAVDTVILQGVLGAALARLDSGIPCYCLPPLCYGKSNEHMDFPGTVALSAQTLLQTLAEVIGSLYRSGFRKIALVNGHGGQPQVMEIAARDARAQHRDLTVFPLFIWSVPNNARTVFGEREMALGIHAGAAETALMLALAPQTVRMDRAAAEWPRNLPEGGLLSLDGKRSFGWLTQDLSESGVLGDPTVATAQAGHAVLDSLASGWVQFLSELHRFNLPPLQP